MIKMRTSLHGARGFTIVHVVVAVVVLALLAGAVIYGLTRPVTVTTTGGWTTTPATVPYLGSATFVYSVTQRRSAGAAPTPLANRPLTFTVTPSPEFSITLTPANGRTDAAGMVTVVVTHTEQNYEGGGSIVATDVTEGVSDPPLRFTIQNP
jgi:hypothetical protein